MKTRKFLALVLAIAMIATIFVVPTAATVEPGAACEILGLLKGDGDGVTAEYLALATTRAQGLLITLRARGLEDEALVFAGEDNFDDATDVNVVFWGPVLAYAKANPDLGWLGDGDGNFRPAAIMSGAELAKVMLAVLGYEQGVDFEWADIATFAASKGVSVADGTVSNDDLAASLVEALALENIDGVVLVDAMIANDVVSAEKAVEAGVKDTPPVDSITVKVAGVKTIEVTFPIAQDTATTVITLKKGAIGQAIKPLEWDTAKKVATITKTTALTKGDYTVTANGTALAFAIDADETAAELVFTATTVYKKAGAQDLGINLLNQYGEKMTFSSASLVGGSSLGTFAIKADGKDVTLTLDAAALPKAGTTATVFAYYAAKNFTVNGTITVIDDQVLTSIAFPSAVVLGKDSKTATRLTEGTTGNTVAYKALDQYGNELDLSSAQFKDDFNLIVAKGTIAKADYAKGKMTLTNLEKGTLTIRAITLTTGNVSDMFSETVYAKKALASFDIVIPDAIYATEGAKFVIQGLDQYGAAIDVTPILEATGTNWTVTPLSVTVGIAAKSADLNLINLTFDKKGSAELYFVTGAITVTKTIAVLDVKVPTSIASIAKTISTEALLQGKTLLVNPSNTVVYDQYDNKITVPGTWSWDLRRLADTDYMGNPATDSNGTAFLLEATGTSYFVKAHMPATEQLQLTLYNTGSYGSTETGHKEIKYDFSLSSVKAADVKTYEFSAKDEIFAGVGASTTFKTTHKVAVSVIGKTSNGTSVTLKSWDDSSLPMTGIEKYTFTGAIANLDQANSILEIQADLAGKVDGETVLKAWNNKGEVIAEKAVALKVAVPARTTVTLALNAAKTAVELTVKDQYGIGFAKPFGNYYTSDATKVTVDSGNGAVARGAGKLTAQTAMIRFVSDDGVWALEVSVTK